MCRAVQGQRTWRKPRSPFHPFLRCCRSSCYRRRRQSLQRTMRPEHALTVLRVPPGRSAPGANRPGQSDNCIGRPASPNYSRLPISRIRTTTKRVFLVVCERRPVVHCCRRPEAEERAGIHPKRAGTAAFRGSTGRCRSETAVARQRGGNWPHKGTKDSKVLCEFCASLWLFFLATSLRPNAGLLNGLKGRRWALGDFAGQRIVEFDSVFFERRTGWLRDAGPLTPWHRLQPR